MTPPIFSLGGRVRESSELEKNLMKNPRPLMFQSRYDNMHPNHIDYTLIDRPLRRLVKEINKSSWAKTIGSCAGRAYHKGKGGFYIIIEVKGMTGLRNLLKWLSLSHALGCKACHEEHSLKTFAIPRAEIIAPNLRYRDDYSVTRPVMGKGWFKFEIGLHHGVTPLNKEQTRGGIKALEFGWKAVVKCSQKIQFKI